MKDNLLWLRRLHGMIYEKKQQRNKQTILRRSRKRISKLKNKYEGKRCFIIGNGPSLRAEDLEKLKDEITFACNRIYNIYDKTNWRPDYYIVEDYDVIMADKEKISKIEVKKDRFIGWSSDDEFDLFKNFTFIKFLSRPFYPQYPGFSDDLLNCIIDGYTTTYSNIQLAAYMGFKEIYLLGVDNTYSKELLPDGTIKNNDVKDHFDDNEKLFGIPAQYIPTLSYENAKEYCDNNSIEIFNATRGGKLEVFHRVSFDSLFDQ